MSLFRRPICHGGAGRANCMCVPMIEHSNSKTDHSDNDAEYIEHGSERPDNIIERLVTQGITLIAIGLTLFHLYTGYAGAYGALIQRSIHLSPILVLTFLLYLTVHKGRLYILGRLFDFLLIIGSLAIGAYIINQYHEFTFRQGNPNFWDVALGIAAIFIVLEATRRVIGLTLPIVAIIFLAYAYFGQYMPGIFGHRGYDIGRILQHIYPSTEGIYGVPVGVSATFVILFITLGAFLKETGGGKFFIDLAFALFGQVRGGPAKVSIVASSLFGTVSGSATANTVGTGAFTIPLMKRLGYEPKFAAAVEAVSSTGGQFMPPIMGAAVFVMVEILEVSYAEIIVMATIPAILYYVAVYINVDLEAARLGLKGMERSELPNVKQVLARGWLFLGPLALLVIMLVFMHWSATKSAFWTIVSVVVISSLRSDTRMSVPQFFNALKQGTMGTLQVALACACAGIVVGVFTLTGLGAKVSFMLLELAQGILLPMLIVAMCTSLLLGMGMPTTPAYIILAVLIAPSLIKAGVPPISAHLFVFYSGIVSAITPPVALAAYAAGAIAGSPPLQTGFSAMRLGAAAFIVPYMFVYSPGIMLIGDWFNIFYSIIVAILGIFAFSFSICGRIKTDLSLLERILLLCACIACIPYAPLVNAAGIAIVSVIAGYNFWRARGSSLLTRNSLTKSLASTTRRKEISHE